MLVNDQGILKKKGVFNVWSLKFGGDQFVNFLKRWPQDGDVLAVAVSDEGSNCIQDDGVSKALADLGAKLSYKHFMIDVDGEYKPFKCGGARDLRDVYLEIGSDKSPYRNSYAAIFKIGNDSPLCEKGSRATEGAVTCEVTVKALTTTTTTGTTTTNTVLAALHKRLDQLEDDADGNELVVKLTKAVNDLEAKLEKEVSVRISLTHSRPPGMRVRVRVRNIKGTAGDIPNCCSCPWMFCFFFLILHH